VEEAFAGASLRILDVYCKLLSTAEARKNPLSIAAANWPATGWLASQFFENCIVVDVGSTTTSIIPVIDRAVAVKSRNDFDKLASGELVYTGCLRTNIATIANSLPLRGRVRQLSSELFALSGDVHLLLGNITEANYSTETADGRGKSRTEALGRLARAVCADIEMVSERETEEMAAYIYDKQLERISAGLSQVKKRIAATHERDVPIVVTGMGRVFLARSAAQRIGCDRIYDLGDYIGEDAALASTSVGVGWMVATELEGRRVSWKR
jgi:probable H4MPT-linked C1 transfer pathway protein